MTLPTVAVSIAASMSSGAIPTSAVITFTLNGADIDAASGEIVVPDTTTHALNANGDAVVYLWPNARGNHGTQYLAVIEDPVENTRISKHITVPDSACDLVTLLNFSAAPPAQQIAQLVGASTAPPTSSSTVVGETGGVVKRFAVSDIAPRVNVKHYGAVGDGVTDDTAAIVAAIEAANGGWVYLPVGIYRITAKLDSLTSKEIRLFGAGDAYHAGLLVPAAGDGRSWIQCDGVGLVGSYIKATNTMTFTDQLKGLCGISMYGVNSAPFAALTIGFEFAPDGCHFQSFVRHGVWVVGASTLSFPRCSFWDNGVTVNCYNVGSADGSGGTPDSPLFMDGCSIRVDCLATSGVANNEVTEARVVSAPNRPTTIQIDDVVIGFSASQTTSFKGINILGATGGCTWNGLVSYGGIWAGWSNILMNSPWLETYGINGFTTSDATPYSLVDWNSSIRSENSYLRQSQRRLRTSAFTAATDFHGYEFSDPASKRINRINPAEIVFGQYDPDGSSTALTPVFDLGTAANPLAFFESTLNALLVSKGNHFYPLFSFPTFQSGNVANGANVTTATPGTSTWSIGGATASTNGGTEWEVSVLCMFAASGRTFHHSTWKQILTQYGTETYRLAETNPVAGVTVSVGAGNNINIANASGSALAWVATYKLVGPACSAPTN